MKHIGLFAVGLAAALPLALAAEEGGLVIEPAVAEAILSLGFMGFSVVALTQLVKNALVKLLKLSEGGQQVAGYVASLIVAAVANLYYWLAVAANFDAGNFVIYTLIVWGLANGWFKFRKQTG